MLRKSILVAVILVLGIASGASALNLGTDLYIPAAARVKGAGTSQWFTDLFVFNPGTTAVNVDIYYLPRDTDNSSVTPQSFTIQPGATLVLADAILGTFGFSSSAGAFRVTSAGQVLTTCRIYNKENNATFGQGLEGVPAGSAVTPSSPTDIVGMTSNGTAGTQGTFRSNIFAVNTSSSSTSLTFDIMDTAGTSLGSKSYTLQPFAAFFKSIGDIGAGNFDNATLHVTATSGSAVVVASKNDNVSSDGTTLEAWWTGGASSADGSYALAVYEVDGSGRIYDGGGVMTVANGMVTSLLGSYVNFLKDTDQDGQPDCTFVFGWGEDPLTTPVALAQFAAGYELSQDQLDSQGSVIGNITWTITFTMSNNLSFTGTIGAVGSGFSGADAGCNGSFDSPQLFKLQGGKQ